MKISLSEKVQLFEAIGDHEVDWGVTMEQSIQFSNWCIRIGSFDKSVTNVDLPEEFLGFYQKMTRLPDYLPDEEAIFLRLERREAANIFRGPQQKSHTKIMPRPEFLQQFDRLTGETKDAFGRLEFLRRQSSGSELERGLRSAFKSLEREKRLAKSNPIEAILQDPEQHFFWETMCRYHGGGKMNSLQSKLVSELKAMHAAATKGLDTTSTMIGFPTPVNPDFFEAFLTYGVFRVLGVRVMLNTIDKFYKGTVLPSTVFITPTATGAGRAIPVDALLAGDSLTEQCNLVAALVEISRELIEDEKADLAGALLEMFFQAIAARLDYACMQGNAADDTTSGLQLGIYSDPTVASADSTAGNTTVGQLQRYDFVRTYGLVSPEVFQRGTGRWFSHPSNIPDLMAIKDGPGNTYVLRTPAETQGEWYLAGFPVSWSAQAPNVNAPGSKIAAFGDSQAYLVGVREDMEIGNSDTAKWSQSIRQVRAIARARCDMRHSAFWATLKLAAS